MKRNHALAVQTFARGLKCDKPGCNYSESETDLSLGNIPNLIDKPCPLCGSSLLTPKDARTLRRIWRLAMILNVALFPILLVQWLLYRVGLLRLPDYKIITVKSDGSGGIDVSPPHDP